ncbi:alpha/beta hydrolase [Streptomyces sp. GC420]|uniref:alpha/beta hydrolase n=1 Tax=Streptomyces sp. GC420 TaxID=2697568 RepID=UPI001414F624|nr:alpha/beta hydrolase [Streptomyces sp. GC420]NBM16053.1 alpha/beta fold hydrolase [Streptomyces sp. GC420]
MAVSARRRTTTARLLVLVLALVLSVTLGSLASCDEAEQEDVDLREQTLDWDRCPDPSDSEGGGTAPSPPPGGGSWECATLRVPLDHADPGGERIGLALIRAKATDRKNRIGSLLFNFGGPGASGVVTLPAAAGDFRSLRGRYDLVSFDPRGIGRSDGVRCEDDEDLDAYYAQDFTPDTAAEERSLLKNHTAYVDACEDHSGRTLPYVGTTQAARDMDLMREVLGDRKLHYFGISYGTELGGVYAHLYPRNVGRAVFDAAVDPTTNAEQGSLAQAKGFQQALDNWARDCVDRGDECLLSGATVAEVEANITELLASLDKNPLPGRGFRELTQTQATNGIVQALYSKDYWPLLEQGVDEAQGGTGSLLLSLSDAMNGRSENGTYSNLQAANAAVNCADYKGRYDAAGIEARLPEFRRASAVFGDYLAWGLLGCDGWPVPGQWEHPDVSADGAAPILVVGTTGDPATPYEGARRMAERLGESVGVELTYKGEGHGAYNAGDRCVRDAVDGYLLDGRVPARGTLCG